MRKIIMELSPRILNLMGLKAFFESVEFLEGKALFRLDLENGEKLAIGEVKMRPGKQFEDLQQPEGLQILKLLEENPPFYTLLVQMNYTERQMKYLRYLDIKGVIYDLPFLLRPDKVVLSILTSNEGLEKLLRILKRFRMIKGLKFQKALFPKYDLADVLTARQKEIMELAQQSGYYEIPRKISTEALAEKLEISKATLLEHLRKAEHRLFSEVFDHKALK